MMVRANTGVAALLLSAAMLNVAYTMLVPLVPELTGRLHLTPLEIAFAFSGFALAKALAQPIGGILVDRVARPPVLGCFGLALTAATIVGLAMSSSGTELLGWRLAWGAAEGITMPVLYQLASTLGANSRFGTTKVLGWFGGSCTAGMVLGPAVVGLLYPFLGFTGVFLAGAAVTAGGGLLLLGLGTGPATGAEPESGETDALPAKPATLSGGVRALIILVGLFAVIDLINNALFAALEPALPLHLDAVTGNGVAYTSVIFAAGLAVFMLVLFTCARLIESRPLLVVATVAFAAETVGLAVAGLFGGMVALCAGLLIFMTAQPVLYLVARRGINLVPKHQLGRAFGAFGLVSDIGFIIGPIAGALIYAHTGRVTFLLMACVAGVFTLAVLLLRRLPDRLTAEQPPVAKLLSEQRS